MMHFNTVTAVVAALAFTQGIAAAPVLQGTSDLHPTLQPRSDNINNNEPLNPIDSASANASANANANTQTHLLHKRLDFTHWADPLYMLIRNIFGGRDKYKKHHYSSSSAYDCGSGSYSYSQSYCGGHRGGGGGGGGGYHDSSYDYSSRHPGYQYRGGGGDSSLDFKDGTRGSYSRGGGGDSLDYSDGTRGSYSGSSEYDFEDGTT